MLPAGGGQLLSNGLSLAPCSSHLGLSAFIYTDKWTASAVMMTTCCCTKPREASCVDYTIQDKENGAKSNGWIKGAFGKKKLMSE